jgi:hypothetical protein
MIFSTKLFTIVSAVLAIAVNGSPVLDRDLGYQPVRRPCAPNDDVGGEI